MAGKVPQRHRDGHDQPLREVDLPHSSHQIGHRRPAKHQKADHQAGQHPAGIVGENGEAGSSPSRRGRQNPVLQAQDSPKDQEAFPRHGKAAMERHQEQEKTDPCHFHPKRLLTEGRQIGEDQQSKPHPGVEHQTAPCLLHVTESPPSQSACGTFPWPAGYPVSLLQ